MFGSGALHPTGHRVRFKAPADGSDSQCRHDRISGRGIISTQRGGCSAMSLEPEWRRAGCVRTSQAVSPLEVEFATMGRLETEA